MTLLLKSGKDAALLHRNEETKSLPLRCRRAKVLPLGSSVCRVFNLNKLSAQPKLKLWMPAAKFYVVCLRPFDV
eukprot:903461-Pelagomonas_calceolata.AAC.3